MNQVTMITNKLEILYAFENDKIMLLEAKKLNMPKACSKSDQYKWLVFHKYNQKIDILNFQSMSKDMVENREFDIRIFSEAELKFDNTFARFIYQDTMHLLSKIETVPSSILSMVELLVVGSN